MFETMAGFVMGDHMGGLTYEPPLDKGGYARHLSPDRRPYKTSDGYICVIVYNDKQWQNFFDATGRDDLRVHTKFATFAGRAVNIDTVYAELARILETKTTAEWTAILEKADHRHRRKHLFGVDHHRARQTRFSEQRNHVEAQLRRHFEIAREGSSPNKLHRLPILSPSDQRLSRSR